MKMRSAIVGVLIVSAVHAEDKVVLQNGKAIRCQVQRFADGSFVCEMKDGTTNKVASYQVKQVVFNAPADDELRAEVPAGGKPLSEKPYSLTRLKPIESSAGGDQVRINAHPEKKNPVVRGELCKEFIWAHAPSLVKFKVPNGAKRFTAVGGAFFYSMDCVFVVIVDGKRLAESPPLKDCPGNLADIAVELPKGAKEIKLVVESQGPTFWANPTFWQ